MVFDHPSRHETRPNDGTDRFGDGWGLYQAVGPPVTGIAQHLLAHRTRHQQVMKLFRLRRADLFGRPHRHQIGVCDRHGRFEGLLESGKACPM